MDDERAPFQSTQPGSDDEWESETRPRGRILWGRLIALAVALLIAFLVGRATAGGGGGVSAAQYSQVKSDLAAARAQLANRVTPGATPTAPATSPSPSTSTTPGAASGTTYVVKPGDTLRGIAEKFYGDVTLVDLIVQANHISDPTLVHQGTKLIIPPKP
ncbi:MAG TPA: LysM domain-containing protein [Actinomycetota bacterium]|jgi:nucleoid-associated protein YgaU|nr:LysM domain-containing protein [Actinomycetota bacterium]